MINRYTKKFTKGKTVIESADYEVITDFMKKSEKHTEVQSLFDLLVETLKRYGIDCVAYSILKSSPDLRRFKVPNLIHTYPQKWIDRYIEKNYFHIDPTVAQLFYERGLFLWEDLPEKMELSTEQQIFMKEAQEHGLKTGASIAFRGPFGELSAVGLASSYLNHIPRKFIAPISLICQQFYFALVELCEESKQHSISLTPREKEILSWCIQGKSNTDIAQILGISDHGVKFHITNVLDKFETNSRTVAIIKAIRLGIVHPN